MLRVLVAILIVVFSVAIGTSLAYWVGGAMLQSGRLYPEHSNTPEILGESASWSVPVPDTWPPPGALYESSSRFVDTVDMTAHGESVSSCYYSKVSAGFPFRSHVMERLVDSPLSTDRLVTRDEQQYIEQSELNANAAIYSVLLAAAGLSCAFVFKKLMRSSAEQSRE
jgi:hypothetical protein